MKKILATMFFVGSVAVVSAHAGQTTTTETKQKATHVERKKTTTNRNTNHGTTVSAQKGIMEG